MPKVLIAAPDGEMRQAVSRALSNAGHRVDAVASGVVALARLASASFDVVVADLAMPGMSGIDLLKALRSASPPIKMVVYTGSGGDVSANTMLLAARAVGADCILYLPFSRDEIVGAVADLTA
jgi:CheY-like chemotaxis protein